MRAIEKLDRLRSTMAVNVLRYLHVNEVQGTQLFDGSVHTSRKILAREGSFILSIYFPLYVSIQILRYDGRNSM